MKAIVISEERFDMLVQACLDAIECKSVPLRPGEDVTTATGVSFRSVNYHVRELAQRIKDDP